MWSDGYNLPQDEAELNKLAIQKDSEFINEFHKHSLLPSIRELYGRAKQTEFVVFDNTSRENELRKKNWDMNLQKAYEIGKGLFN